MTTNGIMWLTPFISALYRLEPTPLALGAPSAGLSSSACAEWASSCHSGELSACSSRVSGVSMAASTPVATSRLPAKRCLSMTVSAATTTPAARAMSSSVNVPSTPMDPCVSVLSS